MFKFLKNLFSKPKKPLSPEEIEDSARKLFSAEMKFRDEQAYQMLKNGFDPFYTNGGEDEKVKFWHRFIKPKKRAPPLFGKKALYTPMTEKDMDELMGKETMKKAWKKMEKCKMTPELKKHMTLIREVEKDIREVLAEKNITIG